MLETNSQAKRFLEYARHLISDEDNWTQFAWARDAESNVVNTKDDRAVKFSFMGL